MLVLNSITIVRYSSNGPSSTNSKAAVTLVLRTGLTLGPGIPSTKHKRSFRSRHSYNSADAIDSLRNNAPIGVVLSASVSEILFGDVTVPWHESFTLAIRSQHAISSRQPITFQALHDKYTNSRLPILSLRYRSLRMATVAVSEG